MTRLQWSELALADLAALAAYLAEQDEDLAVRAIEAIRDSVSRLVDHPRSGAPLDMHNARKLSVPRFRYVVVYELHGEVVVISRIWHSSQNWLRDL